MNTTVCICVAVALPLAAGCTIKAPADPAAATTTLTVGLGATATASGDETGLRELTSLLSTDPLVVIARDGRVTPSLAADWSYSLGGLNLTVRLGEAVFHDGSPVTASVVGDLLAARLPRLLGPAYDDVQEIRAISDRELLFILKRPSRLLVEALDVPVQKPHRPPLGTGPFRLDERAPSELVANADYPRGKPLIDRVLFKPYPSVRAAWAELLRGHVDMLWEVDADALPSLEPSTRVRVFSYRRPYQSVLIFNLKRPALRDAALRRGLNAAIDRQRVVAEGLASRGTPSQGPIWPGHWAAPRDIEPIPYAPRQLADMARPIRLSCLLVDPGHERLGVALQRQLRSVGVDLDLHFAADTSAGLRRVSSGDFDVVLIEVISAPSMLRPYLFWHSKGPYNFGGYASEEVDAALDSVRGAPDDDAYKAGVAAFQKAILNDPPALFLVWGERARAISTAFDVPVEPGRDPVTTLPEWRPGGAASLPSGI